MPIASTSKIKKNAVMIKGIGKLQWGLGMDNSFLGALAQIEEVKGQGLSYEELLVLSGYGFRTNFFDGWCPSSPDATCGFNAGAEILTKLGYEYKFIYLKQGDDCEPDSLLKYVEKEELISEIIASIDEGMPLIAIDLVQVPEWGIITGYQKEGKELLCRTYFDQNKGYEIAQKVPWVIVRITNIKEVDTASLHQESLKLAETLYNTERYGEYTNGMFATETWLNHLKDEVKLKQADATAFAEMSFTNTWIYYCLADTRAIAARYLESNASKFGADAEIMAELIRIYQKEAEILQAGMANLTPMNNNATPETWTAEMRSGQIMILEEFRNLERKAQQIFMTLN
jgi:hypothetical protein